MSRNKQAKTALLSNLPKGAGKKLENIAKLSRSISDSVKKYSGTGASLQQYYGTAEGLISRIYNSLKRAGALGAVGYGAAAQDPALATLGGVTAIGSLIKSATTKIPSKALEDVESMLASKEFRDLVTATPTENIDDKVSKFANSSSFSKFAKAINLPPDEKEQYVLAATRPAAREFAKRVETIREEAIPYEATEE